MTEKDRGTDVTAPPPQADASVAPPGRGPGTAGPSLPRAEICETHTAVLIFLGDHAYKVKKPVDLAFLDYTSVAARRAACEREVASTGASRRTSTWAWESCAARTRTRRSRWS